MQADLVFCGAHQECSHNCQEISCLAAELVFREVPGKSVQRSRQPSPAFVAGAQPSSVALSCRQSPL
jgi:hypothetical protein